jgi:UDP-N-acetylmuramyl pentapeptide phosphotransferase/UDP-N-acetylglucosamine-1-phosphate transferase
MPAMNLQPALAAFVVSLAGVCILLLTPARRLLLDRPNQRSLHSVAVPRSGGIAIATGVAAGLCFAADLPLAAFAVAAALAALSLADDLLALPTLLRLAAHLAAAAAFVISAVGVREPALVALLVLAIAWYANLYNFMDGADGLAGGMAVFGFGAYAWAAQQSGHAALATSGSVIVAASLAFLLFNFHPARLFMGDAGSVPLGFLAGALGVAGWHEAVWPLWFPVLVFAPFVCDATLTLLRRLARRERIWQAHRDHYYQRLVRLGFGHRGTACIGYAVMAACAACALLAREASPALQAVALCASAVALSAIALWIDLRWAQAQRTARDAQG